MAKSSQIILEQILSKIGDHRKILVGFSGGIDSTVLLHALYQLKQSHFPSLQVRAIHVHHGLNMRADKWEMHCAELCEQWNIPFVCHHVTVDASNNGVEAAARDARYQAYRDELLQNEIIVTAQHLDDQAETFLLALKRGSGPAGLSAMRESQPFDATRGNTYLLRPLLDISRQELERYMQEYALPWVEDDSNQDDRYDRNFLRLHIMPRLSERWPHFANAVSRSASLCAEQESLLDELLQDSLDEIVDYRGGLFIDGLVECSIAKRNALLRRWIKLHQLPMPPFNQLERIWQEVALARQDAEPICRLGDREIRRYQGALWVVRRINSVMGMTYDWEYPAPLALPESLGYLIVMNGQGQIRPPRRDEKVTVRFGLQGSHNIVGRTHSRSSKKLWQELGVAPWMRERTPLIYYNDVLISAVGCFITSDGLINDQDEGIAIDWQHSEFWSNRDEYI
ncbi:MULTISPECIES: tRNA lysidine(34) synthetase TilS [Providencia]|uniref:tRNA(Ile)-lysidine synthase n=1 Tax=Providencia rustigianii DSM 4541 TaxID=500637 RepID=D1P1B0_9GAMM|nr:MULTISPECIES: tRNA lysidine(34) synthetase TilS [Providencia]EFB72696.1 tRNA(Ile)-lysidine synthetase [Providencia rustigianii DSM 4541]MTC56732.1 tRNA lysidine(34) synthetase TilS [Providencia rustigianii]SPY78613.1 tRNA(Ile)-lysidine synthase [Providencia rustigianii]SUC28262.1 tRNA(Ile)-lysidine synthase [Providencia rustigianii]